LAACYPALRVRQRLPILRANTLLLWHPDNVERNMKRTTGFAVAAVALALAACGDSGQAPNPAPDGQHSNGATSGQAGSAQTGATETVAVPADVPAFASVIPDARVTTYDGNGAGNGIIMMTTTKSVEEVLAFYDAKAAEAGLSRTEEMARGLNRTFGYASKTDPNKRLTLAIKPANTTPGATSPSGELEVSLSYMTVSGG
jgi:hypothetical protein